VPEVSGERPAREVSIDLVRGADVLLMLFVNEMAGVRGTPAFLLHKPHDADGMTITDVVFPAFLFIIGLAVPFAIGGRRRRGDPGGALWRHVAVRTLGLLAMGVLMVNAEYAGSGGVLSPDAWNVLMTLGVALAWLAPADGPLARARPALRIAGAALLVALVFLYRSREGVGLVQLRPHWWGILGLIGWSYLVAASLYLLAGDRPAVHVGGIALLYGLYLADEAGGWLAALPPYLRVGRVMASHSAVALAGVLLGVLLVRHRREGGPPSRLAWPALGAAAALAAGGLLLHALRGLHPAFWINKVMATPPWCLLTSALTGAAWVAVFLLIEAKGGRRWPKAVSIAGENALLCYLIPPLLLSLFALSAPLFGGTNVYEALGETTGIGTVRSVAFAWIVVRLGGLLRGAGVRLQL
jgi:predicted acyltransferase